MAIVRKLKLVLLACLLLFVFVTFSYGQKAVQQSNRLNKTFKISEFAATVPPLQKNTAERNLPAKEVIIEEKPHTVTTKLAASRSTTLFAADGQVQVEESDYKKKVYHNDDDIPDSFKTTFYFFVGLSTTAVLFILVKVYRLRLSRAERKYGVQGDRTTQELTPLPISIEDANSDEDDQTLFEVNRQQIRIL